MSEHTSIVDEFKHVGHHLREVAEGRKVSFLLTYCIAQELSVEQVVYVEDTVGTISPNAISPHLGIASALLVDPVTAAALAHYMLQEDEPARIAQGTYFMRVLLALKLAGVLEHAAENEPIFESIQNMLCTQLANSLAWRERDGEFFASFGANTSFKIDSDPKRIGQWRIQIKLNGATFATHDAIESLDKAQQLVANVWVKVVGQWGMEIATQGQS